MFPRAVIPTCPSGCLRPGWVRWSGRHVDMTRSPPLFLLLTATLLTWVGGAGGQTNWGDEDRRSGFVVGFGIGPSITLDDFPDFDDANVGVSTDLRIGAEVGKTTLVYYLNQVSFFDPGYGADIVAAGVSGIGVSFVESRVMASLGFGIGVWGEISTDGDANHQTGLGATVGFGYEVADLWILDVSLAYAWLDWPPGDVLNLKLGINILSH